MPVAITVATRGWGGWSYALFGAAVAFAGPPIYIHAPSLYAEGHGLSLGVLGAVLLGLRLLDFGQDPLLAWWIARTERRRRDLAAGFACLLGLGSLMLFAPNPPIAAVWWFALSLALVFTGFSALQILYYASGIALAERVVGGHRTIAGWREMGVLAGVSTACVAPGAVAAMTGYAHPFWLYALAFCGFLAFAVLRMAFLWPENSPRTASRPGGFAALLRDAGVRRLLLIALVNALPTGLTATLFVFFVEHRLEAEANTGPALLVFFVAAAGAAPLWASLAVRIGSKRSLLLGMGAAILAFLWVLTLGSGDWPAFYLIAALSGACMGADMTLLPAMLAARLAKTELSPDRAFGLWGFVSKAALALAAGIALPFLALAGFNPVQGVGASDERALTALAIAYAGIPCVLKAAAALFLALTPIDEGASA